MYYLKASNKKIVYYNVQHNQPSNNITLQLKFSEVFFLLQSWLGHKMQETFFSLFLFLICSEWFMGVGGQ